MRNGSDKKDLTGQEITCEEQCSAIHKPLQSKNATTFPAPNYICPDTEGRAHIPILSFTVFKTLLASSRCSDAANKIAADTNGRSILDENTLITPQDCIRKIYYKIHENDTTRIPKNVEQKSGHEVIAENSQNGSPVPLTITNNNGNTAEIQRLLSAGSDTSKIGYSCVIRSYITFIADKCLEYNNYLKCFVLKRELWGLHEYMTEFYCHVLYMLEALKNEEEFENEIKNEYEENKRNEEKEKNKLDESNTKTETCGNIEKADETTISEINANLDQIIKENTEQNDKVVTVHKMKAETDFARILKSKKDDYKVHLVS